MTPASTKAPTLPVPFVVGVARSGTTLLRLMLDAHPDLAIPAETHFVPALLRLSGPTTVADCLAVVDTAGLGDDFGFDPRDLATGDLSPEATITPADFVRRFFGACARHAGKPRWGDKTPTYLAEMAEIAAALPEVVFVHIIRDARAVALSRRSMRFGPGTDLTAQARDWSEQIWAGRVTGAGLAARYVEFRYEDLVHRPEDELRRLGAALELPFDAAMLDYSATARARLDELGDRYDDEGSLLVGREERVRIHEKATGAPDPANADRWRRELDPAEITEIEQVAGPLLVELGYA